MGRPALQTALVLGVGAVALGSVVWFGGGSSPANPTGDEGFFSVVSSVPQASVTVHVSGAVARPGVVVVPSDARVGDAVAAAGGAIPEADLTAVNLAATLVDGQHIVVPDRGPPGARSHEQPDGLVWLNSASVEELQQLPGVGPVLAERIVAHRAAHGPFGVIEDLLDVPGIGETRLSALREHARP